MTINNDSESDKGTSWDNFLSTALNLLGAFLPIIMMILMFYLLTTS